MVKYSVSLKDEAQGARARGSDLRVHFKNTWQVARALRKMTLTKAKKYLEDVLEHKRCIPYIRFSHAAGRTPQAKEFGLTQGRWPRKSVDLMMNMLKNAESNADAKGLNTKELSISHILVQRAQKIRRRTYRAHGRIGAFMASPCHVELFLEKRAEVVPKPTSQALRQSRVKPPAFKRFGDRAHRCTYR
ncbi:60S ribosomal protein L17 [Diplonema papillatum]|nr:60S ribosomal protein L17 [Diplonema papillatum]